MEINVRNKGEFNLGDNSFHLFLLAPFPVLSWLSLLHRRVYNGTSIWIPESTSTATSKERAFSSNAVVEARSYHLPSSKNKSKLFLPNPSPS